MKSHAKKYRICGHKRFCAGVVKKKLNGKLATAVMKGRTNIRINNSSREIVYVRFTIILRESEGNNIEIIRRNMHLRGMPQVD